MFKETPSVSSTPARTPRLSIVMESSLCFVCDTSQENENAHYSHGEKEKCSLNSSETKLIKAQRIHILHESSHFYPAANSLKMATNSLADDIFAADALYHKSCYNKFTYILLH